MLYAVSFFAGSCSACDSSACVAPRAPAIVIASAMRMLAGE